MPDWIVVFVLEPGQVYSVCFSAYVVFYYERQICFGMKQIFLCPALLFEPERHKQPDGR